MFGCSGSEWCDGVGGVFAFGAPGSSVAAVLSVVVGLAGVAMGAGRVLRWVRRPVSDRPLRFGMGFFTVGALTLLGFGGQVHDLLVGSGAPAGLAVAAAAVLVVGPPAALLLAEADRPRGPARPGGLPTPAPRVVRTLPGPRAAA